LDSGVKRYFSRKMAVNLSVRETIKRSAAAKEEKDKIPGLFDLM